jgi:hypothetical protein
MENIFRNNLKLLFATILDIRVWYFDISDSYTFIVKSFYGFPKICCFNEEINAIIFNDMRYGRFEKYKQINGSNDTTNFNAPFVIYVGPYENMFLNIFFDKDDSFKIMKETTNQYLIENKDYQLLSPSKLLARIGEDSDSTKLNLLSIVSTWIFIHVSK